MTYVAPELTLIGQAEGVILGGGPNPVSPDIFGDTLAALEAEW